MESFRLSLSLLNFERIDSLWKRSRRLQRWSLISRADVVAGSFFVTGETRPTAERDTMFRITDEQNINESVYHSLLD